MVIDSLIARLTGRGRISRPTTRRPTAMALWSGPSEGYMHAKVEVVVDEALAWIERERERTGTRITITHVVGRAVAEALRQVPELNHRLVSDTLIGHETVDLSFLVGTDTDDDVGWVKVEAVESKSVHALAEELTKQAAQAREDGLPGRTLVQRLPIWLLRLGMRIGGWFAGGLGRPLGFAGLSARPFGSVVITSAAAFDLEEVHVARTAFAHVSMNLVICAIRERAVVVDGQVQVRRCLNLCTNSDHRYVDGRHLGRALKIIADAVADPSSLHT